jgi:RND family efflux transporter MFP subunit
MRYRFFPGLVCALAVLGSAFAENVPGFVSSDGVIDVASEVRGVVDQHFAEPGDRVQAGDAILVLDTSVLDARIAHAEALADSSADLEAAEARLAAVRERADAMRRLAERGAARQEELRTADLNLAVARADKKAAQERQLAARLDLKSLQAQRARLTVRAPIAGIIADVHVQPGELVDASGKVATLVSTGPARIEAFAHADLAARLSLGARLPVILPDGASHRGEVIFLSPRVDGASQWQEVHVRLIDEAVQLAPGRRVSLDFNEAVPASTAQRLADSDAADSPATPATP